MRTMGTSCDGTAVTTTHTIRFSYWSSSDFASADLTGTGAIDTSASNYVGWYEEHTVTPTSDGAFSVELGSSTALPTLDSLSISTLTNLHIQIEVKVSGAADSTYDLLDSNTSDTTIDRQKVLSVPLAGNADLFDQRDTGTGSGSIPFLNSDGLLPTSTVPSGTNQLTFTINADGTSSGAALSFGQTLTKTILYDQSNARFNFDASVHIQGQVTVTGSLTLGNYTLGSGTGAGMIRWTGIDFEGYDGSSWVSLTSGVGGGGGSSVIQLGDVTVVESGSVLDFNASDFTISEGPPNEANISLSTDGLATRLDARYINQSGDTMTGTLKIAQESGDVALAASGALKTESGIVLNYKNAAQDAVLTFGNDLNSETLLFSIANNRFEFSDDVHTDGSLTASGTLTVEGAAVFESTVKLGGGTYTFPGADSSVSGAVLKSDSAGNLSWGLINTGSLALRTKRILVPIHEVTVIPDGTNNAVNVFAGTETGSTSNIHHYLRMETSSGTMQNIDLRLKVRLPDDFVSFTNESNDIRFSYRNSGAGTAQSKLDILVEDDEGDDAFTAADGQDLFSATWADYTDEFDGGSFDPEAGEYVYITVKAYTSSAGVTYSGEILLTYTAQ